MSAIQKMIFYLTKNKNLIPLLILHRLSFLFKDKLYLKLLFRFSMGYSLDLHFPKTFCEKMQWLKLYNRNPLYPSLVDKAEVKRYVADIIGEKYIIPTIFVFESVNDLDIDLLPNKFVLKTTHGGGGNGVIICKDKSRLNIDEIKKKLTLSLKADIYKHYREWPYKDVPKKIIAEEYINDDKSSEDLIDYKFFCFDGKALYCQVITNRTEDETIDFYDRDWVHQEFIGLSPNVHHSEQICEKPINYEEMLYIADKLAISINIPFVRIDLYNINGNIYFGEITFFPASGIGQFKPDKWDRILGNMINLK